MKNRKLLWIFVLAILVASLAFSVSAAEEEQSGSIFRVNPLYEDCVVYNTLFATENAEPDVFYTTEQAVIAQLRAGMVARKTTIVVGYQGSADLNEMLNEAVDNALEHTGVPTQGDYLAEHWKTYNAAWKRNCTTNKTIFTFQFTYLSNGEQEKIVDREVAKLLDKLDVYDATDYQKVSAIYDYMCQNITYDTPGLNAGDPLVYTAYAALVKKSAVCQGYASLFYRLALELDVDNRVICGFGNGGPHAWNIVQLGNYYYNLDATWDASNAFVDRQYEYFLKAPRDFEDHYRSEQYETAQFHRKYPMDSYNYVPPVNVVEIVSQPANGVAPSGKTASVTFKATGDGLTYTWYHKNATASKFAKASYTGSTYKAAMSSSSNGRYVYCIVKDQYGNSLKTKTVRVFMGNPAKITVQPTNAAAPSGKAASVSVKATGDGLSYTWYHRNATASKFAKAGTTGTTYTANMSSSSNGRYVYCVITDRYGNSVKTNTVRLTLANIVKITAQPKNTIVPNGKTASVKVGATGDGLTYTWYHKNATASKFAKASVTGATYTAYMSASSNGRYVYCIVKDQYGNQVKTATVKLIMGNTVKITAQPKTVTVARNAKATVSVKATGDGLTYTWYHKNPTASKFAKANVTGSSYSAYVTAASNGRYVYCVVRDKYGNQIKTGTVALRMK